MSEVWKKRIRIGGWILLILYLCLLIYALLFPEGYSRTPDAGYRWNLIPFQEISRFWIYREQVGIPAAVLNLLGNVVGFMPLGYIPPILSARFRSIGKSLLLGFCISLLIELLQLVTRVGIFDVDDLILNTLGAGLGSAVFLFMNHILKKRRG